MLLIHRKRIGYLGSNIASSRIRVGASFLLLMILMSSSRHQYKENTKHRSKFYLIHSRDYNRDDWGIRGGCYLLSLVSPSAEPPPTAMAATTRPTIPTQPLAMNTQLDYQV
ncbi:hypothetical protein Dimus_037693 [Dionaea muscipula]